MGQASASHHMWLWCSPALFCSPILQAIFEIDGVGWGMGGYVERLLVRFSRYNYLLYLLITACLPACLSTYLSTYQYIYIYIYTYID